MELLFFSYPSWSLLVVRVVLGVIFFAHGAQKVFGWFGGRGLKATVGYFQQGKGHGFEMNLALIGMALAVLVGGAGALSIDRLITPR